MVETIFKLVGPLQSRSLFQSHPNSLKILTYGTWRLLFGFIYSSNEVCRRFLDQNAMTAHDLCDYLPTYDVTDAVLDKKSLITSFSVYSGIVKILVR